MFHCESLPRRSDSSTCFTASLFLASRTCLCVLRRIVFISGRNRLGVPRSTASLFHAGRDRVGVSRRVFSSQVGIVNVFHGESLPRTSGSCKCFTASHFIASRNCLGVSRRISFLQVGVTKMFHGESLFRRSVSSRFFTASFLIAV